MEPTPTATISAACPELLQSDVLKVGHHGSSSSTTKKFLKQVQPELAIISCGEGNKYGHPTEQALERLKEENVKVYRTDIHGDITIWYDGNEWLIATQKIINL